MRELLDILTVTERADAAGTVLATVVRVEGSSYRIPGARMLIDAAGQRIGSVSGGCLEADVSRRGRLLTPDQSSALVNYDGSDEDVAWGFGLGCNGSIDVFIERLDGPARQALDFIRQCVERRINGTLVTIFKVEGNAAFQPGQRFTATDNIDVLPSPFRTDAAVGVTTTVTFETPGGRVHALVETIRPPLPLVIFGAGHDAVPLVRAAKQLGWHVTVCDRRPGYARADRFPSADAVIACEIQDMSDRVGITPETVAVVMTHHFPDDRLLIPMLLQSPARYVGALGPRARTDRIIAGVAFSADQLSRLHAPVGLDIGAEGPDQVALAVVAEIIAEINRRPAGLLRNRVGPIHEPPSVRIVSAGKDAAHSTPAASER